MNVLELISVILNVVFGSGLLISLLKLRQTK